MNKSLLGIVISYITGIILAYFIDFAYKEIVLFVIVILLLSLFFLRLKNVKLALILFYSAVILIGITYSGYRTNASLSLDTAFLNTTEDITIKGTITSDIETQYNKEVFYLRCETIEDTNGIHPVKGKVQIICNTDDFSSTTDDFQFRYKDKIEIKGFISTPVQSTVPGVFDYRKYLQQQGISGIIFVSDTGKITKLGNNYRDIDLFTPLERPSNKMAFTNKVFKYYGLMPLSGHNSRRTSLTGFTRLIISIRKRFSNVISKSLQEPYASVLGGILLGRRKSISPEIQNIFANAGVMHILAVSGLHVGLVAAIFIIFFRKIYIPPKIAALLTIFVIFIYTFITGARPSAMRAAIMATVGLGAFILERDKNFYNSLAIACFVILIINPLELFNVGFQLSFSATLAILYLTPKINKVLKFLPRWLGNIIAVTTAAQIGVFPIVAYYFNKISLVGILSNIIVIPLTGISVALGFLMFFGSFLGMVFVKIFGFINGLCIAIMVEIIKFFSNLPYAFVYVPTPSVVFIGSYYIFAVWMGQINSYKAFKKFIFVILFVLLAWFSYYKLVKTDKLIVSFIDVGQADAIFIEFPDRTNMMIDGGGNLKSGFNVGRRIILPFLWHKRITKVDKIVLTHPHYNHLDGLLEILECFPVGKVFLNGQRYDSTEYMRFLKIIKDKNIPLEVLKAPRKITLGRDIIWKILNPIQLDEEELDITIDNNSIVSKLDYKSFSILLTGDITDKIQRSLSINDIKSKILQIPYHAKEPVNQTFLLKVAPECVIISSKTYNQDILKNLCNSGIYSTNRCGTIVIATDGKTYHISTFKENQNNF